MRVITNTIKVQVSMEKLGKRSMFALHWTPLLAALSPLLQGEAFKFANMGGSTVVCLGKKVKSRDTKPQTLVQAHPQVCFCVNPWPFTY